MRTAIQAGTTIRFGMMRCSRSMREITTSTRSRRSRPASPAWKPYLIAPSTERNAATAIVALRMTIRVPSRFRWVGRHTLSLVIDMPVSHLEKRSRPVDGGRLDLLHQRLDRCPLLDGLESLPTVVVVVVEDDEHARRRRQRLAVPRPSEQRRLWCRSSPAGSRRDLWRSTACRVFFELVSTDVVAALREEEGSHSQITSIATGQQERAKGEVGEACVLDGVIGHGAGVSFRNSSLITRRDIATCSLARGKLEDGVRAAAKPRTPGADVRFHLQHFAVAGKEDSVDREAHEERVDRRRGSDEHSLAGRKLSFTQKSLHPRPHAIRDDAAFADDRAVGVRQRDDASSTRSEGLGPREPRLIHWPR